MARLLWQLIETARTNVAEAMDARGAPGIAVEHRRIRAAANDPWIAPGVPLVSQLYSHADDFRTNRIYARLRRAEAAWPDGHEPQAFLLVFAKDVTRGALLIPGGDPIEVATDIVEPAAKQVDGGPYLALVAIGKHAQARGYAAVRAYAQPILDGRRFVPVHAEGDRALLTILVLLERDPHACGVSIRIKKPVFDLVTNLGPCRPDFMLDVRDQATERRRMFAIELTGPGSASDPQSKAVPLARMRAVSRVIEVAAVELGDANALAERLATAINDRG